MPPTPSPAPPPFKLHWAVQDTSVTHNYAADAKPPWAASTIRGCYWPVGVLGPAPTLEDFIADPSRTVERVMEAVCLYIPPGYAGLAHNDATETIGLRPPLAAIAGTTRVRALTAFHALLRMRMSQARPLARWALWGEPMMPAADMDSLVDRANAYGEITSAAPAMAVYDWVHPECYPKDAAHNFGPLCAEILTNAKSIADRRRVIPVISVRYNSGGLVTPAHYAVFAGACQAAGIHEGAIWGVVGDVATAAEAARQAAVLRAAAQVATATTVNDGGAA